MKQKRRRSRIAMRRTVILGLALLALVVGGATAPAQEPGVGSGAIFKFGVDARALAMGGAFVAMADGYSAPYWNPAGLALAQGTHVGGMNTNLYGQGIQLNYVGALTRLAGFPVGAAFNGMMAGGLEVLDASGASVGTISANEFAFTGGTALGLPLGEMPFIVGGNAKYYAYSYGEESASGFGGDLGLLVGLGSFTFGAAVTDVGGTTITWSGPQTDGTVDQVDMEIRAGGALSLGAPIPWTLAGQYDVNAQLIRVGAEFNLTEQIALRGGAQRPQDGDFQFSAGGGLSLGAFSVDAAFVQNTVLGNSLVVSGEFVF